MRLRLLGTVVAVFAAIGLAGADGWCLGHTWGPWGGLFAVPTGILIGSGCAHVVWCLPEFYRRLRALRAGRALRDAPPPAEAAE